MCESHVKANKGRSKADQTYICIDPNYNVVVVGFWVLWEWNSFAGFVKNILFTTFNVGTRGLHTYLKKQFYQFKNVYISLRKRSRYFFTYWEILNINYMFRIPDRH